MMRKIILLGYACFALAACQISDGNKIESIKILQEDVTVQSGNCGGVQLGVFGTLSNGAIINASTTSTRALNNRVSWTVENPNIADITSVDVAAFLIAFEKDPTLIFEPGGIIKPKSVGTTKIVADYFGLTDTITVTVSNAPIREIVVTPPAENLPLNTSAQFNVFGIYGDNTVSLLNLAADWRLEDSATGTLVLNSEPTTAPTTNFIVDELQGSLNQLGRFTAPTAPNIGDPATQTANNYTIKASACNQTTNGTLNVSAAEITALDIDVLKTTPALNTIAPLRVVATYGTGATQFKRSLSAQNVSCVISANIDDNADNNNNNLVLQTGALIAGGLINAGYVYSYQASEIPSSGQDTVTCTLTEASRNTTLLSQSVAISPVNATVESVQVSPVNDSTTVFTVANPADGFSNRQVFVRQNTSMPLQTVAQLSNNTTQNVTFDLTNLTINDFAHNEALCGPRPADDLEIESANQIGSLELISNNLTTDFSGLGCGDYDFSLVVGDESDAITVSVYEEDQSTVKSIAITEVPARRLGTRQYQAIAEIEFTFAGTNEVRTVQQDVTNSATWVSANSSQMVMGNLLSLDDGVGYVLGETIPTVCATLDGVRGTFPAGSNAQCGN